MAADKKPFCKNLVLDAGPLLSLSPLRGLAETYITVPQVLAELKDKNAKEHLERLGLNYGIKIEVKNPDPASLTAVIQWAKKTGDYSVLSHPDLCVLALTHTLHERSKKDKAQAEAESKTPIATVETSVKTSEAIDDTSKDQGSKTEPEVSLESLSLNGGDDADDNTPEEPSLEENFEEDGAVGVEAADDEVEKEPLNVELQPIKGDPHPPSSARPSTSIISNTTPSDEPLYDDPSESDDGEGEWITPDNVGLHKSRALDFLPDGDSNKKGKRKQKDEYVDVGCMTADFAMQNVLMQMGLNLVGTEGKRIQRVKTWVLRCHACFKICKDASKKFCPSCGNPSLLRASVTISALDASSDAPAIQVHLKPNFQYKIRGTKYSIPAPKPGSAKHGPGEGLILREDQAEYMRAKKRVDGKREREEAKMMKGLLSKSAAGENGIAVGSWMDPDWVPEIIAAGAGGKGRTVRSSGMDGDMPAIGYGRKNPNERRRNKK